jgi:hypothetical protein
MPNGNPLLSKLSIFNVYTYTLQSKFSSRFAYKERDTLKGVIISKVQEFQLDRTGIRSGIPQVKYKITAITSSYPQYLPYTKETTKSKQRKYRHSYSIILELADLSIHSLFKFRVGSDRLWKDHPPKSMLKTISKEERTRIESQIRGSIKDVKKHKEELKKRIENRKKSAPYLDAGDYNSRVLGLNGDFYFRVGPIAKQYGCLYGKYCNISKPKDLTMVFFPKHCLRLIEILVSKKILKLN